MRLMLLLLPLPASSRLLAHTGQEQETGYPPPKPDLFHSNRHSYEVRAYPPLLVAEVDNPNHDNSASFRALAGCVGL